MYNFYKSVKSKKVHNPQYGKSHFIQIPARILLIGSSGSGKTNTLLNLLKATNDTWDHITLCCKNKDEPLYEMLESKLGNDMTIYENGEIPDLSTIEKDGNQLFIFDDLVGNKAANQQILEYYKMGRKKNITSIYLSQSYYQTPKFIRSNLSHLIIRKVPSTRDLSMILSENPLNIDKKELISIYKHCTDEFTSCMTIDLLNGKIYKCFNIEL